MSVANFRGFVNFLLLLIFSFKLWWPDRMQGVSIFFFSVAVETCFVSMWLILEKVLPLSGGLASSITGLWKAFTESMRLNFSLQRGLGKKTLTNPLDVFLLYSYFFILSLFFHLYFISCCFTAFISPNRIFLALQESKELHSIFFKYSLDYWL